MEPEDTIQWKMSTRVVLCWIVTVAVTAIVGLAAYHLAPDVSRQSDRIGSIMVGGLLVLGACIVIGLIAWAVGATRAARRYGDAVFELETVPVPLGGTLKGRIRAVATMAPDQAVNLTLRCKATEIGGGESGGGSRVAWESEQLLTLADVEQLGGELLVPVEIPVPAAQPPTGRDRRNRYSWQLDLSLEPRSGYAPRFPLTVLRTAESPPEPEAEPEPAIGIVGLLDKVGQLAALAKDGSLAAIAETWHQDPPMERPPHARIEVMPRAAGGVEVVLPGSRATPVFAIWFALTLPLWLLLPGLAFQELRAIESPPAIAYLLYLGLGFGVPLLVNGLAATSLAWQTRRVEVGSDGVIVHRRLGSRRYPSGKFTTAAALGSASQGWSVCLERTETELLGRLQVASLRTKAEARWLAAELRRALGVRTTVSS